MQISHVRVLTTDLSVLSLSQRSAEQGPLVPDATWNTRKHLASATHWCPDQKTGLFCSSGNFILFYSIAILYNLIFIVEFLNWMYNEHQCLEHQYPAGSEILCIQSPSRKFPVGSSPLRLGLIVPGFSASLNMEIAFLFLRLLNAWMILDTKRCLYSAVLQEGLFIIFFYLMALALNIF